MTSLQNKKVTMIVLNAVSHDIRVLKEAKSLKNANYDVSIIGLRDNMSCAYEEIDGIKIFRTRVETKKAKIVMPLFRHLIKPWKTNCLKAIIVCYLIVFLLQLDFLQLDFLSWKTYYLYKKYFLNNLGLSVFYVSLFVLFGDMLGKFALASFNNCTAFIKNIFLNTRKTLYELLKLKQITRQIQTIIEQIDPDVVHCHDLNSLIIGAAYKRTKGKHRTLVYDSHEIFEKTNGSTRIRQVVFAYIQAKLSKSVDGFITVNQSIADYLKSKYPKLPEAYVIKNASVFRKSRNNENMFEKNLNIPKGKKIVLFQGGFGVGRGLTELVKASTFLRDDWIVIFMGWGNIQVSLERLARARGVMDSRVFFCDKVSQEELLSWTSSATIGIIPYENTCLNHFYCTPNKLWEYTLAGIPILASPFPEMEKIIDQGVGWLLEDPIDAKNIASVINSLSDKDIQMAKKKSREFIKKDNWSKYEKKLTLLYNNLQLAKQDV